MLRKIIDFIYLVSGTKLYLEWLLITNPTSKNPIIRFVWGGMKDGYTAKSPKMRLAQAYSLGFLHLFMGISFWTIDLINILVNFYPILVQIYIGYRCHCVIIRRANNKSKRCCEAPLASYRR